MTSEVRTSLAHPSAARRSLEVLTIVKALLV